MAATAEEAGRESRPADELRARAFAWWQARVDAAIEAVRQGGGVWCGRVVGQVDLALLGEVRQLHYFSPTSAVALALVQGIAPGDRAPVMDELLREVDLEARAVQCALMLPGWLDADLLRALIWVPADRFGLRWSRMMWLYQVGLITKPEKDAQGWWVWEPTALLSRVHRLVQARDEDQESERKKGGAWA